MSAGRTEPGSLLDVANELDALRRQVREQSERIDALAGTIGQGVSILETGLAQLGPMLDALGRMPMLKALGLKIGGPK